MNPSQVFKRVYESMDEFSIIPDPGNAGEIAVDRDRGYVPIVTAAAETRTVADPEKSNVILTLSMKTDGGDCVFTFDTAYTESGQTSLTFANVGESITLVSVQSGSSYVWRVLSRQGAAALTSGLTTITHTAPSSDDFAIQNLTSTSPFGFVTADEGNTVLKVIANLQTRVGELEARLQAAGHLQ